MSNEATPEPAPTNRSRLGDALLASAVVVFWWYRYGRLGPYFQADTAVMGAMALRPLTRESFYFWGQDRLGALIPCLARWPIHQLGTDAGTVTQGIAFVAAGVMLCALLGLFRSWAWKVALALLFAFQSMLLAVWMLDPCQPGPLAGMSAALQLLAFLGAVRRPTPGKIATASFLAGFTLWAGENCSLFLPGEAAVLAFLSWRSLRGGRTHQVAPAAGVALMGLVPPLILVIVSKHFSHRVHDYYKLRDLRDALSVFTDLQPQFRSLTPVGWLLYPLALILALLAVAELWRWGRSDEPQPKSWAIVGVGPLLAFTLTSSMDWFRANEYNSRYLAFGVLVAALASGLLLESLLSRLPSTPLFAVQPLVALIFALVWIAPLLPARSEASHLVADHWRQKTALALEAGCLGLIGDYWQSYPYLTLSQGAILATPHEKAYVRSKSLARDAVLQPVVCVVPWEAPLDSCPPELTQFEARLRLRDRYEGKAGDEAVVFCRYRSSLAL